MKLNEIMESKSINFNNLPDSTRKSFTSTFRDIYTAHEAGPSEAQHVEKLFADFLKAYFGIFYPNGGVQDLVAFHTFVDYFPKTIVAGHSQLFSDNLKRHISTMAKEIKRGGGN